MINKHLANVQCYRMNLYDIDKIEMEDGNNRIAKQTEYYITVKKYR